MAMKQVQIPDPEGQAVAAKDRSVRPHSDKWEQAKIVSCQVRVTVHIFKLSATQHSKVTPAAVIAGKTGAIRIGICARMTHQVVVKEIQRREIEHFLQADHIRISRSQDRSGKPSICQIERDGVWCVIFSNIIVARTIKPHTTLAATQAQVLDVESDNPHDQCMFLCIPPVNPKADCGSVLCYVAAQ